MAVSPIVCLSFALILVPSPRKGHFRWVHLSEPDFARGFFLLESSFFSQLWPSACSQGVVWLLEFPSNIVTALQFNYNYSFLFLKVEDKSISHSTLFSWIPKRLLDQALVTGENNLHCKASDRISAVLECEEQSQTPSCIGYPLGSHSSCCWMSSLSQRASGSPIN